MRVRADLRADWFALLASFVLALAPFAAGAQEPPDEAPHPAQEPAKGSPEQPAPGSAPESAAPRPPAAANPMASGPLLHGTLELSLQDAIRMGLENNLDVQVERYAPMIADLDVTAAWGAYDPEAFAETYYKDLHTPNAFAISGVNTSITRSTPEGEGGLRGILPLASTQFSAQFSGYRKTYNSTVQTLSPEYSSGWSINLTQPILRNLIWNQPWTQVRTSRLLHESSEDGFRRAVMDEVQKIEDAYWDLIANDEALRVARKSLDTARALREQTRTQFQVGVVSKVEVTEAEAGVSQREVELIRAENQYRNQQDVLIDLVLGPNLRAASTLEIRPTDRPDEFTPYEVDVEGAVNHAFEHRPELAQANKDVERSEVQFAYARNQRLPALDGVFSFGQSGLAGDQNPGFSCSFIQDDPSTTGRDEHQACLDGKYGQGRGLSQGPFDNTYNDYNRSPQYIAGARLSIPIPNRTASANASRSELELARARTSLHRLEQQIVIEVRQSARNLLASQEGIVAARSAREAAAEQLRAEQIRLQYGESTPFDVLQREEALVGRERDEIGAFRAYRTSVTALDRAQGTILRNRNIDIAEVAPLR
ncbi:MAG TPA: TolC family protein [Myxococcota bacterium]|nr:TolC family protein [Myxococcota bacterium]